MVRRKWMVLGLLALVGAGAAFVKRDALFPQGAVAQAPAPPAQNQPRTVPVDVATAVKKSVPVRLEALGTVTPIASVAVKSRLETEIVAVHFADGADVKQGDLLFTLDSRAIEAQLLQAQGVLGRDKAQLEGAERDLRRYTELLARGAGTQLNVENARTQSDMLRATITADQSAVQNLQVQLSYAKIRAPISGRVSAAAVKVGNFVRPADTTALATIMQIKPIYVAFAVPQHELSDIRKALEAKAAAVEALIPGEDRRSAGRLTMLDNTVDIATGMVTLRATMDNADEALWPGALVNTQLTLRNEEAVVVPSAAVQIGQNGTFVFVVKDGAAVFQPVRVARTISSESVISSGLAGGETVVTDGQMLLSDGTKVTPRQPRVGS